MTNETRFILLSRPANHFCAYEELSAREIALGQYSDAHKETFGYRPYCEREASAGQIYRALRSVYKHAAQMAQWEREEETERVKAMNAKAHAKRIAAAKVAQGFTLGARWP